MDKELYLRWYMQLTLANTTEKWRKVQDELRAIQGGREVIDTFCREANAHAGRGDG